MGESTASGNITVGEWTVEPDLGRIRRGDQTAVLEPRQMDLLIFLAQRAGQTISTDELAESVWSGRAMTDAPVYQGIAQLRKALDDNAREPRYIATVMKKGYRLVAPVGIPGSKSTKSPRSVRRSRYLMPVLSMCLAASYLFLSSADVSISQPRTTLLPSTFASIAVMPFVDMSADGDRQYLADGIAEELIHRIAVSRDIWVVARTSAFSLRDTELDAQEIGARLGAEVILEGSIRQSGDRLRITAQLIDSASGYHIWSQSYEPASGDLLIIQDHIAQSVVQQLQSGADPALPLRPWTQVAEAAEAYYLGMFHMQKLHIDSFDKALNHFQQAVTADPQFALAYAGLANTWMMGSERSWGRFPHDEAMRNSRDALLTAESLESNLAEVLVLRAREAMREGDFIGAEELYLQAIDVGPNESGVWFRYGRLLMESGRPQEALVAAQKAVQLDPLRAAWRVAIADLYFILNMPDETERELLTAIELDPDWHAPYASLGAHVAGYGQLARAIEIGQNAYYMEGADANWAAFSALGIGWTYFSAGDFDTARDWFAKSGVSAEDHWFAANIQLQFLLAQDRDAEVVSLLTHWTEKRPDIDNIFSLAGLYQGMMGQDEKAVAMFEHALSLPGDGEFSNLFRSDFLASGYVAAAHLARLYSLAGADRQADELLEQCDRFIEESSYGREPSPGAKYALASVNAIRGEDKQAMTTLRDASDSGWVTLWFVRRDPVFKRFHGESEFESVLDQMQAHLVAEREKLQGVDDAQAAQ